MSRDNSPLDDAIRRIYLDWDTPLDTILTDPVRATEFANAVRQSQPDLASLDVPAVLRRAITLRKRRGGLGPLSSAA